MSGDLYQRSTRGTGRPAPSTATPPAAAPPAHGGCCRAPRPSRRSASPRWRPRHGPRRPARSAQPAGRAVHVDATPIAVPGAAHRVCTQDPARPAGEHPELISRAAQQQGSQQRTGFARADPNVGQPADCQPTERPDSHTRTLTRFCPVRPTPRCRMQTALFHRRKTALCILPTGFLDGSGDANDLGECGVGQRP
jgi:hypothetical protein